MKTYIIRRYRLIGIATIISLLFITDIAEAQYGAAHRRTRRRTAVVVSSATHAKDQEAQQQQQQQEQEQQEQTTQADTVSQPATTQGEHLPYGTVVTKLPEACEPEAVNDIQYYHCGNDYYRAAYQENNLVYVTTEPPK